MTKGRVAERTQTGARHSTPAGDRTMGTRGAATPGNRDHLKVSIMLIRVEGTQFQTVKRISVKLNLRSYVTVSWTVVVQHSGDRGRWISEFEASLVYKS
ncbi:hypothetical protein U0070_006054 [Myodes glareolus]|uniref:Uncharacterized protein n=1 Tax=Myodes glareolus TaxID=447135 RepID=A0AAW0IBV1_MYOGA